MQRRWWKRLVWAAVSIGVGASYAACAWLWAKPYGAPHWTAASPNEQRSEERVAAARRASESPAAAGSGTVPWVGKVASAEGGGALPGVVEPATSAPVVAQKQRTPALTNTRNFLVIGLDRRADGTGPALADTLVVVVLDESSQHVGLVSIPRDLYVDIPDGGTDRINTVYQVAKRTKREPLALLSRVVADTLELPIEHALALDLGVFERAVDAVGGVEVNVPCAIRDNFVDARAEGGRRVLDLDAGQRHLDGVTAAMYVRSRHGRSDFSRARRQQAVLLGVQHTLSGLGVLELPELWSAFESSVETDMRRIQLLALGRRALGLDATHLHGLVIGHEHVRGFRTTEGKAVLLPNYEAIDASLASLFSAESPGARPKAAACEPKDAALGPS